MHVYVRWRVSLFSVDNLKGLWWFGGLPPGVSSLQDCIVSRRMWQLCGGYTVVSMVRLGMITCKYRLWSADHLRVWCGVHEERSNCTGVFVQWVCAYSWLSAELCSSALCVQLGENLSLIMSRVRLDSPTKSQVQTEEFLVTFNS